MSNKFNGWSFENVEMQARVKYIAVMRGDLDLTNAYALPSDEALAHFLRQKSEEGEYSRLYAIFEVARVVPADVELTGLPTKADFERDDDDLATD